MTAEPPPIPKLLHRSPRRCDPTLPAMKSIILAALLASPVMAANEHVVLIHGLCRTSHSMQKMDKVLTAEGYTVHTLAYPTRKKPIRALAEEHLAPLLEQAELQSASRLHFVTHSLGGIVLRQHLGEHKVRNLGHIIMLGPPNQGSHLVDKIGHWRSFRALNGPAGSQLGTSRSSLPNQLGPLGHPHAVIAGSCSINWINSRMIPGPDDGKVAVSHTALSDTTQHLVMKVTHPYLMQNKKVIEQVTHYLREGNFQQ